MANLNLDFETLLDDYERNQTNLELFTEAYAMRCHKNDRIDPSLFDEYGVKRGLRDKNGVGVLAGLTNISLIRAFDEKDGIKTPCDGHLLYRGIEIEELVDGFSGRYGFEEVAWLLLFGDLPTASELEQFHGISNESRRLPVNFTRDVIMKAPTGDLMNSMTKSVLTLASYDPDVSDLSLPNVLRQYLKLISVFPQLAV